MNKRILALILTFVMVSLAGCGGISSAQISTIYIDKAGKVKSVTVESLSAEQYQEADLRELVNQAIEEYNDKQDTERIILKGLSVKKEQARLTMEYATSEDYEGFNGRILFSGTVAKAKAAGYDFNTDFIDENEALAKGEVIIKQEDLQVIITNEPVQIKTSQDIMYVSVNAVIIDKRAAQVEAEAGATENGITFGNSEYAYIIY